jgi:hypothetical protein
VSDLERVSEAEPANTPSSMSSRIVLAVFALVVFVLVVWFRFQPFQLRFWQHLSWVDVVVMVALVAPFLASRWLLGSRTRATRLAWWVCALMALDVLAFAVTILAPTHGHPSLEVMVSFYLGVGKVALVPVALLFLVAAALRGERATIIVLGTVCLIGETLYTLGNPDAPLGWFAWLAPAHA